MDEMIYKPLIQDMTWSYSRIKTFEDCPYRFFLKYIHNCEEEDMFYASYGKFIHKLIEMYYTEGKTKNDIKVEYILNFSSEVRGQRPNDKIVCKYFKAGLDYIENFKEFGYKTLGVEQNVQFEIKGYKFVGFVDYIGRDGEDIIIVDNKSRELKPRSGRSKPTQKDQELDDMLTQLYIYAIPINDLYGRAPKKLCFNCFKNNVFIEEPFVEEAYKSAIDWASNTIEQIMDTNEFLPKVDYFKCNYLCGVKEHCEYYLMSYR